MLTILFYSATVEAEPAVRSSSLSPNPGSFLELDLQSAIALALQANRDIQSAYLGRVSEQYSLRVAEDRFRPDLDVIANHSTGRSGDALNRTNTQSARAGSRLSLRVPTGGELSFTWANQMQATSLDSTQYQSGLDISFVQPLLRDAGSAVNRAPVRIARINERINVLALKSTINSTITHVITAYRQLLLEQRQLDIAERSLARARALLETNRAMIEAGRMARQDVIQTEADVSQRELDLVAAHNTVDSTRLALLNVLDIDPETSLTLTETLRLQEIGDLDFETTYNHALANQPVYLQALLQSEIAELDVLTARNERRWRLDATVTASLAGSGTAYNSAVGHLHSEPADYSVGLVLSIPLGDLSRKQGVINAKVARHQQALRLMEVRETMRIDVKDRLRTIQNLRLQVDLAKRAAELAEQQLDIENLKFSQGRSSNFQVLNLEDQLIAAQTNAATAEVSYLNALTRLDETLGTTMDTWRIPFETSRYPDPEQLLADK